jgi:hypothetical protein
MGLRAVGIIDGDTSPDSKRFLADNTSIADAIIRLPNNAAIEIAIVENVPEPSIRQAIVDVAASVNLSLPLGWANLSGSSLKQAAVSYIKNNGLHAPYLEALPAAHLPALAIDVLHKAIEAASGAASGIVQV